MAGAYKLYDGPKVAMSGERRRSLLRQMMGPVNGQLAVVRRGNWYRTAEMFRRLCDLRGRQLQIDPWQLSNAIPAPMM
ncbi:MAG: hypothetical protein MI757_17705 [Pirellulales bacterium]|nr:hypothetical protein [Pirellulales bacterium]